MDINALAAALAGKHWILVVALLVFAFVGAAKQGWLSLWIAQQLSPKMLPYIAMSLSFLGLVAGEVIAGKALEPALVDGLLSLPWASLLHELAIEGVRSGRELFPSRQG
jgi:hypothetical protein